MYRTVILYIINIPSEVGYVVGNKYKGKEFYKF